MNVLSAKPLVPSRCIKASSYNKRSYIGIGDKTIALMELSDRDFIKEINRTRYNFAQKFPHLTHLIFEYKKQCTLLDLDFWYERPVPERCEKFVKMDIMTLMNNIDADSEEGKAISNLCNELLQTYIKNYEK
jgi:hypothetical protein